jgi:hypothetical protein
MAQFAKGKPRHPNAGRRKGTPNKGTVRARQLVAERDDKTIIDGVIEGAKLNDPSARTIYFRYVRPSSPRTGTYLKPIEYTTPKTVEEAHATVLELGKRLAKGEISIEAHDALVNGIRVYLASKAAEQQRQLDALEADLARKDRP